MLRINDLLSHAVGCCQNVILINEGASAKLSLQIHQRSLKQCIEKMSHRLAPGLLPSRGTRGVEPALR